MMKVFSKLCVVSSQGRVGVKRACEEEVPCAGMGVSEERVSGGPGIWRYEGLLKFR